MARSDTQARGKAKARRPPARRKPTQREREQRRDRIRDVWGVVLLVVAALAALGLWFGGPPRRGGRVGGPPPRPTDYAGGVELAGRYGMGRLSKRLQELA
jgi:hypothetical protein